MSIQVNDVPAIPVRRKEVCVNGRIVGDLTLVKICGEETWQCWIKVGGCTSGQSACEFDQDEAKAVSKAMASLIHNARENLKLAEALAAEAGVDEGGGK